MSKTKTANHQNSAAEFALSEDEVKRLFKSARETRDELIARVLYFGGIRRQELCDLDVPDIQWDRERVVIRSGKGDKSRTVVLPVSLLDALRKHLGRRTTGPVFQSQRKGKRLAVRSINHVIATLGNRAGISNPNPRLSNVNPHLLRHSFARHYLSKGGDIRKLSQLLGHANVAITHAVYGTASEEEIHEEYRRLMGD